MEEWGPYLSERQWGTVREDYGQAFDTLRGSRVRPKKSSEILAIAEPWFLAFNAKVSFRSIMNPEDLAKAGYTSIGKAAERYGISRARSWGPQIKIVASRKPM